MADGTPTKRPRRKPAKPSTAAKVKRIEEDVRTWYRRGKQALGLSGEGAKDVGKAMTRLSEEVATNPMTLRRARQFAEVYENEGEVESLLKLRTPEGLPLGWSHVQELISIKTKADRVRMQKRAAKEGWTVRRLKAEVQRLLGGKRSEGGRKFAPPRTPEEALRRLADQGRLWINLAKQTVILDNFDVLDGLAEAEPDSRSGHLVRLRELLAVLAKVEEVARMTKVQVGKLERRLGAAPGAKGSRTTGS